MTHDEYKKLNKNGWREDEVANSLAEAFSCPELYNYNGQVNYSLVTTLARICDLLEVIAYSKCDNCTLKNGKE